MLKFAKTPRHRVEVRIYGPPFMRFLSISATVLMLTNLGLGLGLHNTIYYLLAGSLLIVAVVARVVYRGHTMYVEKKGRRIFFVSGVKNEERKKIQWPEKELTEARLYSRVVYVGKEPITKYIVGITRRALRPTRLVEVESLEDAVNFAIRLVRALRCSLVDARASKRERYDWSEISALRRKLYVTERQEGERVARPPAIKRLRKSGGYGYEWAKKNSARAVPYFVLSILMLLAPIYVMQQSVYPILWPMLLWLPSGGFGYLAFRQWATCYILELDGEHLKFRIESQDGSHRKIKWEQIRGLRRVGSKLKAKELDVRTPRPLKINCCTPENLAYLEEQIERFRERHSSG